MEGLNDTQIDDHLRLFLFHCLENTVYQRWFHLNLYDKKTIREHIWVLYRNCTVPHAASAPATNAYNRIQRNKLAQLIAIFGKRQFPVGEHEDYDKQIKNLLENQSTFILGVVLVRANCEEILNTRSDVTIMTRESFSQSMAKCLLTFLPILNQSLHAIRTPEFHEFSTDIFSCIQSIIQCDIIEDQFLSNIVADLFVLAREPKLGGAAMETLTELFNRQRIFREHDIVAKGVVELLRAQTIHEHENTLIHLMQVMSKHLTVDWWTKVSICSVEHYLELLWNFTTKSAGDPSKFCEKLSIWGPILNYYAENAVSGIPDSLINIAKLILNRMSLQYNPQLLEIYSIDQEGEGNEDSEWTIFTKNCLDTFSIIAQIQPLPVFELILLEIGNKPHGPLDIFANIVKSNNLFIPMLSDAHNTAYLRLMLRDLGTHSQVLARALPSIKANLEGAENELKQLDDLVTRVIELAHLLLAHLQQVQGHQLVLYSELINTEAQLFNSVIYLFSISQTLTTNTSIIVDVFDNAVQYLMHAIEHKHSIEGNKTLLAALAEFLKGIIVEFRPKVLMFEGKSIIQLMKCTSLVILDKRIAQTLYRTIFSCLLLSFRNASQQEQPKRILMAEEYVRLVGHEFLSGEQIAPGQHKDTLEILEIFEDILTFFSNENSFSKSILVQSLRPITEKTFCIFKNFTAFPESEKNLEQILRFFHALLRTLQTQLSIDVIKELILAFIENCKKCQCQPLILNYLLKTFLNIVKQHTHSSFVLLSDIVKLSVEEVAPLLFQNPTDESVLHLYAVFDAILQERWQFFFKSQVLRGFSPGASDDCASIAVMDFEPHHAEYIAFILNAYGHALNLHANLDLTRLVLESLVLVDDKHKLFQTMYFQKNFLTSYQTAIIQCLAAAEGIINYDLLVSVLYKMSYKQMNTLTCIFMDLYKAARGSLNGVNIQLDAVSLG